MRIRSLLLLFFIIAFQTLKAQDYKVVSMESLPLDMTAREHIKEDERGRQCAVLRIATQNITPEQREGFHFECDYASYMVERQIVEGEIWVWVSPGMKTLKIKSKLGNVDMHTANYGIKVEALHTYRIVFQGIMSSNKNVNGPRQQYLAFEVSPHDAILEVNGEQWSLNQGSAQRFLPFGTYSYRVFANDYHVEEKSVVLDESGGTKIISVNLRPKFGWIEVAGNGNLQDAGVYVDDQYVGKAPCKSQALTSGSHNVKIVKEMYHTCDTTLVVVENETSIFSSPLKTDYDEITLNVDADAEIWINGEKKGFRSWTGFLANGTHNIVCKQNGCEDSSDTLTITGEIKNRIVNLPIPMVGFGSLNVESTPNFATIYVDDKPVGETPMFISSVSIGHHELRLVKEGYSDYREDVVVSKGESELVKVILNDKLDVWFNCNVEGARLSIDGKVVGVASGIYELSAGKHDIKVSAFGCQDLKKTIDVGTDNTYFPLVMHTVNSPEFMTCMVNEVSFSLRFIKGDSFEMGSDDANAQDDEKPVHMVKLDDYYIGQTEVTQALWRTVMGNNPSKTQGNDLPVESVSWDDIQSFLKRLNQLTGKEFRLPTEAEWEYAARGGKWSEGTLYSGSSVLDDVAWYNGNSNTMHQVKTKQPNELGLYDMSGNVWEWCNDKYAKYDKGDQNNPIGPSNGRLHILRGGCWRNVINNCRVSCRYYDISSSKTYAYGFRLALSE